MAGDALKSGFTRTPTRDAEGTASFNRLKRLGLNSGLSSVTPVTFLPGRVNALSGCNECHAGSRKDNQGLYLAGGAFFGAVGPTPNLTPDDSGLPNGLTLQQFSDIMRNGVDPDGNPISLIMPWEVYRNMTDRDLKAIYEFLLSIPTQPGPR